MENKFNADIWRLNNSLVETMLEVERSLMSLSEAIKTQDVDAMDALVEKDHAVNEKRDHIESECLRIIMRRHPFAGDLRQVLGIFKLISDVERISDNIRDISESIISCPGLIGSLCEKSLDNLHKIGENVIESYSMAIKAFALTDIETISKVIALDDKIDEIYNVIKEQAAIELEAGSKTPKALIALIGVTKHYEKIGDHCVNIAEWVKFILFGDRKIAMPPKQQ